MFESLSEKLTGVFRKLSNQGRLTEEHIDEALKEVRRALLAADVHFSVVRDFQESVRERAIDSEVLQSLTPAQQIIKIVNEELTTILGGTEKPLASQGRSPDVILMVGLQGSGKTTTAAKLAAQLKKQGRTAMIAAADLQRPAAVQQLTTLGKQLDIPVYEEGTTSNPVTVAKNALKQARQQGIGWLIVDTAGRLHIDDDLMDELEEIKEAVDPGEVLLVVDAMTGQDALRTAEEFGDAVKITGLILTKMDGDARGGAALSITSVTGIPIKFMGTGEKLDALEPYHPDRLASRILGMGDMLTLIEKAQETFDQDRAAELQKKMQRSTFNLEDFLEQMQAMKNMGSMSQIMEMIPGLSQMSKKLPNEALDEKQFGRTEAIIRSMTPQERNRPDMISGSRRRRIARGSGVTPAEVNGLLNQFKQSQKLMKQIASGKRFNPMSMFK